MTKPAEADAYVTTPANGAIGQQVTLTVTSNTVSGATSYTIELSTSPTFPAGQVTSGTSSTPSVSFADLNFGTLYYTRIKTNLSPVYGETRTFTTGDALSLSYITTPAQAATGIATTVNITANYLAGASTYIIQLSADNTFLTGVIEKNSSSRTIAFDDLYHNTRYYARVSSNLTPGQWGSSVRYFNTRDHVISSPAANATNVNYNITVTAGTIAGASVYTIEVNPSPTFDPATAIVRSGAASQVFTLGYNTLYYVRCTSDRATGWGSTRSFTTGNPVSLARVTAPANGTTANYTNLQVTVQSLLGATSYTVELNTDPAFNPATALTLSNSTNNIIFPSLSSSTVYYTRVKTSLEPNTWGTTVTNFTTVQSGARVNTVATPEDPVYLADFAVEVYGNPFKQRLKLLVTSPEQANAEITLSDLNGRRIHEFSYPSNSFIEIEKEIPNGLYLLFVKVGPHVKAIRVMKMD
jgi:hypothetical protein